MQVSTASLLQELRSRTIPTRNAAGGGRSGATPVQEPVEPARPGADPGDDVAQAAPPTSLLDNHHHRRHHGNVTLVDTCCSDHVWNWAGPPNMSRGQAERRLLGFLAFRD